MRTSMIHWTIAAVLAGCGASQAPTDDSSKGVSERKTLAQPECEAQGGTVVGDIGNGAIHRPGYLCPSGKPPLGTIVPRAGEPIPVEGSVCCPK
jgi:hypothetical protein